MCTRNSPNLPSYITSRVHIIEGHSTVPPLRSSLLSRLIYRLKVVFFVVIDFLILNYQPFNLSTFKILLIPILLIPNRPHSKLSSSQILLIPNCPHFSYILKILPKKEIIRWPPIPYIHSHVLNQNHSAPQVGHNNNTAVCLAAPLPTTIYTLLNPRG